VLATADRSAVIGLLKQARGDVVECCFLAELTALRGREHLKGRRIFSLLRSED